MRVLQTTLAQRLEAIGRLHYFDEWNCQQRTALAADSNIISVNKGYTLISKGRPIDSLYVAISGQFRFFIPLPGGQERVVGVQGEGGSFGEGCLTIGANCPYSGVATKDSHVLVVDGTIYRQELHKSTRLMSQALTLFAQRLMGVMADMEICAQRSSLERVACYLGQFQPEENAISYTVPLVGRKMDIATRIGLTPETFSRVLTFLEQQGILLARGKQITVLSAHSLKQLNPAGCKPDA